MTDESIDDELLELIDDPDFDEGYRIGIKFAGMYGAMKVINMEPETIRDIMVMYLETERDLQLANKNVELQKYVARKDYLNNRMDDDL